MLIELFLDQDEPRTLTEVYLRKLYHTFLGREPDANGLIYWSNLVDNGTVTWQQVSDSLVSSAEYENYLQQANGNPVVVLQRRDFDGNAEPGEIAFNTNFDRQTYLNYTQTGDLLSLPYEHRIYIQNRLASREVNVNPFGVSSFVGVMTLDPPEQSLTFNSTSTPTVLNDAIDGYTSVLNAYKASLASKQGLVVNQDNDSGFYGSYYGEWELLSQGTNEIDRKKYTYTRTDQWAKYKINFDVSPTILSNSTKSTRTDKVYDPNIKPKMNDVDISFKADGLKPNTRLYAFFGDRAVSDRCVSYLKRPDGTDITLQILVTDSVGSIRGKFSYRESDLNFDAAIINFALSDSSSNGPNRTTYVSMPFNSLSLPGYGEETIRTRIAKIATNKTTERVALEPRTVIVNDAGPITPASIDIIDYVFVYGLGRKPSAQEKAAIYDKWVSYGIADMSAWNAIENRYTNNNTATPGVEMIHPWGWTVNHPILTYVDRAVSVVPNGSDSSDLRNKYLAAATYPYGRWTWYWIDNENPYPATINTAQFMATEPTPLTPPWIADISYNSFNAAGEKVFKALRNFCNDVLSINNNDYSKVFTGGVASIAARELGLVDVNNQITSTPATLPKTFVARKHDINWSGNTHTITSVWNSTSNDCQQVSGATWVTPPTAVLPETTPANIFELKLDVIIQPRDYNPVFNFTLTGEHYTEESHQSAISNYLVDPAFENNLGRLMDLPDSDVVYSTREGMASLSVPRPGRILTNSGYFWPILAFRPTGFSPSIEGKGSRGQRTVANVDVRLANPLGILNTTNETPIYANVIYWTAVRAETKSGNIYSIKLLEDPVQTFNQDGVITNIKGEKDFPDSWWSHSPGFQVDQSLWPVETVGTATPTTDSIYWLPATYGAMNFNSGAKGEGYKGTNILPSNNYVNFSHSISLFNPWLSNESHYTIKQFGSQMPAGLRPHEALYLNEFPGYVGPIGLMYEVDKIKAGNFRLADQSPIIKGTPYQIVGTINTGKYYGIAVGITKGQTGLNYPVPIKLGFSPNFTTYSGNLVDNLPDPQADTGSQFSYPFFRTHIPAVSGSNYWQDADGRRYNHIYVYIRQNVGIGDGGGLTAVNGRVTGYTASAAEYENPRVPSSYQQWNFSSAVAASYRYRLTITYDNGADWYGPSTAPPAPPPPPPPSGNPYGKQSTELHPTFWT